MARTALSPIRVRIVEADPNQAGSVPDVQIAYSFTSTDGDTISKTRDRLFDNLSGPQKTAITDLLTSLRTRISNLENIV